MSFTVRLTVCYTFGPNKKLFRTYSVVESLMFKIKRVSALSLTTLTPCQPRQRLRGHRASAVRVEYRDTKMTMRTLTEKL